MFILLNTTTGCGTIKKYYMIQDHPKIIYTDIKPIEKAPTVEVFFEFQSNGQFSAGVTERYRPQVMSVLKKSELFSSVNTGGIPSDANMNIIINNVYGSLGGAMVSGCISGLTLSFLGSKVTDNYVIESSYTLAGESPVSKQYKYGITSTSGLIVTGVEGVEPKKTTQDAFNEMVEQFILQWLSDLQQQGHL